LRSPRAAPEQPQGRTGPQLPTFPDLLETLLRSGLLWTHTLPEGAPANARINMGGGRFVYIPQEVAGHLPPPPVPAEALPQVAHVLPGSARTLQRDLYLLWSALRETPAQLTNAGLLRVADLKRLAPKLLAGEAIPTGTKEGDVRRFFFIRRLLDALGLLSPAALLSGSLEALPSPSLFEQPAAERVWLVYEEWREATWWNELWATYVPGETRASGTIADPAPSQVMEARQAVLDTLARLARRAEAAAGLEAAWVALDALADDLHNRADEFLVERETAALQYRSYGYYGGYSSTVYSPYQYNSLLWTWARYTRSEEAGWEGVERVFIEAVLAEGLYWLGLVNLGYAQPVASKGGAAPKGLLAVRLTDMGRWLLLDAPPPAIPAESGRVVVQPNFRILAFDPIADSVLARLDGFANRLNAERAIEYELTQASVYRSQLAGDTADAIAAWLERTTGAPLPQNVARTLAEWQLAFERIVVRSHVGWLEAARPDLVDAVLAEPALAAAVVKRVTPTGLIVRADQVAQLEQALLAAGELPARSSRPEEARRGSITLAEDGGVSFVHPVPSLYVYGYLRPFCQQPADSPADLAPGWRLTPASVARASAAGLDAPAIIAELEAMAAGGVPAGLRPRIKAWSGHYGSATMQTVTLIQFRDQQALDELLADPAIARFVKPFRPEAQLGLATVAPEDVAAAWALLSERGVERKS
jgi:hypothetical protein